MLFSELREENVRGLGNPSRDARDSLRQPCTTPAGQKLVLTTELFGLEETSERPQPPCASAGAAASQGHQHQCGHSQAGLEVELGCTGSTQAAGWGHSESCLSPQRVEDE